MASVVHVGRSSAIWPVLRASYKMIKGAISVDAQRSLNVVRQRTALIGSTLDARRAVTKVNVKCAVGMNADPMRSAHGEKSVLTAVVRSPKSASVLGSMTPCVEWMVERIPTRVRRDVRAPQSARQASVNQPVSLSCVRSLVSMGSLEMTTVARSVDAKKHLDAETPSSAYSPKTSAAKPSADEGPVSLSASTSALI